MVDMFNGWGNPFGGSNNSESTLDLAQSVDPEPVVSEPVTTAESETVAEPVVKEPAQAEHKEPAVKKAKQPRKAKASSAVEPLSEKLVRRVLAISGQLDAVSAESRSLVARLLGVKSVDDTVRLIVALGDSANVGVVRRSIADAVELAGLDDLRFAVAVAGKSHAERKALWDLASSVAVSVPEGKFPQADVAREVSMLRAVLSGDVAGKFSDVLALLS